MRNNKDELRERIILTLFGLIDLITGVLSLMLATVTSQVIATIASGATFAKAIKMVYGAKKASKIFQSANPPSFRKIAKYVMLTPRIFKFIRSKKMKNLFQKIAKNAKNNPVTLIAVVIETIVFGSGGVFADYLVKDVGLFGEPWNTVFAAGVTVVLYAIFVFLTVYLGHDNELFAKIRKIVAQIGGENAVELLTAMEDTRLAIANKVEQEAEEKERKKKQEAEDEAIYAKIQEEEAEIARQERAAKIAEYKRTHATDRESVSAKDGGVTV